MYLTGDDPKLKYGCFFYYKPWMKPRLNTSRTEYKLSSLMLKSGTFIASANQNIKTDFLASVNITEYEVWVSYLMLMQEAYKFLLSRSLTCWKQTRLYALLKIMVSPFLMVWSISCTIIEMLDKLVLAVTISVARRRYVPWSLLKCIIICLRNSGPYVPYVFVKAVLV